MGGRSIPSVNFRLIRHPIGHIGALVQSLLMLNPVTTPAPWTTMPADGESLHNFDFRLFSQ